MPYNPQATTYGRFNSSTPSHSIHSTTVSDFTSADYPDVPAGRHHLDHLHRPLALPCLLQPLSFGGQWEFLQASHELLENGKFYGVDRRLQLDQGRCLSHLGLD